MENLSVSLSGHLTEEALTAALEAIQGDIDAANPRGLIVDALAMTGYDPTARRMFIDWHKKYDGGIKATAVITSRAIWNMVIQAMAMATGKEMKAFSEKKSAEDWLSRG